MDTRRTKLLYGGLAGFSSIAIIQIASAPKILFDQYLTYTIILFAISLPFLIMGLLISYFKENYKKTFEELGIISFGLEVGPAICFLGITSLFFHFNQLIGLLFLFASAFATLIFLSWDKRVKALNAKTQPEKKSFPKSKKKQSRVLK